MIFENLSRTINEFEEIINKLNEPISLTRKESDSLDCIDFSIAQSIIQDIGKTTSLKIANHILTHYENDVEY